MSKWVLFFGNWDEKTIKETSALKSVNSLQGKLQETFRDLNPPIPIWKETNHHFVYCQTPWCCVNQRFEFLSTIFICPKVGVMYRSAITFVSVGVNNRYLPTSINNFYQISTLSKACPQASTVGINNFDLHTAGSRDGMADRSCPLKFTLYYTFLNLQSNLHRITWQQDGQETR